VKGGWRWKPSFSIFNSPFSIKKKTVIARRNDEAIQKTYFATLSAGLLRFARNDGGWRKLSHTS
jgi:hypothetical protein